MSAYKALRCFRDIADARPLVVFIRRRYVLRLDAGKDHALGHNNRCRNCTEQPR